MSCRIAVAVAAAIAATLPATSAQAQELRGIIRAESGITPIDGAAIVAIGENGREQGPAISDSLGRFLLPVRPGNYRLSVQRVGYASFTSDVLPVASGETVRVEITLSERAVPIDAIQVISRRRDPLAPLAGYYDRLDFYGRLGLGRFLTREQIEARNAGEVEHLLAHGMGLRLVSSGRSMVLVVPRSNCRPVIFVDGMRGADMPPPSLLEGAEVYVGAAQAPGLYHDPRGCGVVLLWTQRGASGDGATNRRLTWRRLAAAGGVVALIIALTAL
jgi:hypothetical protein